MRPAHYRTRDILTARQREVLRLVARGYTNPQIASELGITLDGAKFQVSEILARLDFSSREEAAEWWRAQQRPSARIQRALRSVAQVPLRWIAAGCVASLAVAGAIALVISLPSMDGAPAGTATSTRLAAAPSTAIASAEPGDLTATTTTLVPCAPADGPGYVRLHGVTYVPIAGPPPTYAWDASTLQLSAEVGQVTFDTDTLSCDGYGHTPVDGDGWHVDVGTELFAIVGFKPSFRIATSDGGNLSVFQALDSPNATRGSDLLDIRGRVRELTVIHYKYTAGGPEKTTAGQTSDADAIASVVGLLLESPVGQPLDHIGSPPYTLDLLLDDGTTIGCWYLPAVRLVTQGDVPGIEVPNTFRDTLEAAIGATLTD